MKEAIKHDLKLTLGENRLTAHDLAVFAGHKISHQTVPAVRNIIRLLIEEGCPIGSDQYGYFWITEREQLEDTLEGLQSRCDAIQKRITGITKAYNAARDNLHRNKDLSYKDRCRYFVIYLAETANIPYQAIWSLAYRKLQKLTGVDLINLPPWYQGSVLNYVTNLGIENQLYAVISGLERVLI